MNFCLPGGTFSSVLWFSVCCQLVIVTLAALDLQSRIWPPSKITSYTEWIFVIFSLLLILTCVCVAGLWYFQVVHTCTFLLHLSVWPVGYDSICSEALFITAQLQWTLHLTEDDSWLKMTKNTKRHQLFPLNRYRSHQQVTSMHSFVIQLCKNPTESQA